MFVLAWATLFFAVASGDADTGGKALKITGNMSAKEGDALNLTCSAEGFLPHAVKWAKHGSDESLHNETITEVQSGTKMTTLVIFNMTTDDSGQYVCTAQHQNNTLKEKVNITVTYARKPEITGTTTVKEGDVLNLTCSVDSFPPSVITWTKSGSNENLRKENRSYLQSDSTSVTLIILNVAADDSGQYICTAKHLNNREMEEVNVTVKYITAPEISGKTTVKEGEMVNLTCSAEGFPLITWTKVDAKENLSSLSFPDRKDSVTLIIPNVTAEHSGQYICTAKHLNTTLTVDANVTVILRPKILNKSGCTYRSEDLICMCISQGVPVPTVRWPLLEKQPSYVTIKTVINPNTLNSTFVLPVKDRRNTTVECISSNEYGEVKERLIFKSEGGEEEDRNMKILRTAIRLEVIIAFFIGILLACICCSARLCCRKKPRDSGNLAETLEMVMSQQDPEIDAGPAWENNQTHHHHPAGEAEVKSDVEYSDINFPLLPRNGAMEAGHSQDTANAEYAEIKKQHRREQRHDEEEEVMIGEEEETKHSIPEEIEGEDAALYSNMKDVMDQM